MAWIGGMNSADSSQEARLRPEILEAAASFFTRTLQGCSQAAATARHFWQTQRGFTAEQATRFRIGLSPPGPAELFSVLQDQGFPRSNMERSGLFLARPSPEPERPLQSRFRGRLMIPILDPERQVIGFFGRALSVTAEPPPSLHAKYAVSPTSPFFRRDSVLYGWEDLPRNLGPGKPVLLAEGPLDVIRLKSTGAQQSVSLLGMDVYREQIQFLSVFPEGFIVLVESNPAGHQRALRILALALKLGVEPTFVLIPNGQDPDDWLRREGPQAMAGLLDQPIHWINFILEIFEYRIHRESASKVIQLVAGLIEKIPLEAARTEAELRFQRETRLRV